VASGKAGSCACWRRRWAENLRVGAFGCAVATLGCRGRSQSSSLQGKPRRSVGSCPWWLSMRSHPTHHRCPVPCMALAVPAPTTFPADFFTDPVLQQWYLAWVNHLVNRVNTVTGVAYNEDPTIMVSGAGDTRLQANKCPSATCCVCPARSSTTGHGMGGQSPVPPNFPPLPCSSFRPTPPFP
jgi:hypothetical protein